MLRYSRLLDDVLAILGAADAGPAVKVSSDARSRACGPEAAVGTATVSLGREVEEEALWVLLAELLAGRGGRDAVDPLEQAVAVGGARDGAADVEAARRDGGVR